MRGLILSGGCFLLIVIGTAVGLRLRTWARPYRLLLSLFACATGLYAVCFWALPALPGPSEPSPIVDFCNGFVLLAMLFHGFWTALYASCLGPSATILVDTARRGDAGITADDAIRLYGGESADTLLQQRIVKLLESGYLRQTGDAYTMLPPARKYAWFILTLRRIFNL